MAPFVGGDLVIFHWNIQSIGNKVGELEVVLHDLQCDVCCITEHWKTAPQLEVLGLQNYNLASRYCRDEGEHGGSAIYVAGDIEFRDRQDVVDKSVKFVCEISAIELVFNSVSYVIVALYRPYGSDFNCFCERYFELMELTVREKNKYFVFAGDFNIDLKGNRPEKFRFLDMLTPYNYYPLIDDYTRVTETTKSCLDNIIVWGGLSCTGRVVRTTMSDHFAQISRISIARTPSTYNYRVYSDQNIVRFSEYLLNVDWGSVYLLVDVDQKWALFSRLFDIGFERYFPLKTSSSRGNRQPGWMTEEIKRMRKQVSTLNMMTQKCSDYRPLLNRQQSEYRRMLDESKKRYYSKKIYESDNKSKSIWSAVNTLTGKPTKTRGYKLPNMVSGKQLADNFNQLFVNVASCTDDSSSGFRGADCAGGTSHLSGRGGSARGSMFLFPATEGEIIFTCLRLKNKKSAGLDGVPALVLKRVIDIIAKPLCDIVNASMDRGVFPAPLKLSVVTPVFKHGNVDDLGAYRPISIQSIFSKLFEALFLDRLLNYLRGESVLNDFQHGFLKGRNVESAVDVFIKGIIDALEKRQRVCGVFLDLSKAFDVVDHGILLSKLYDYGIRGPAYAWLQSYISDRQQVVRVVKGGVAYYSGPLGVTAGVPQGSILGPVLFVLYINDLPSNLMDGGSQVTIVNYADDTNILARGGDVETVGLRLEAALGDVSDWLSRNHLRVNVEKTKAVYFQAHHNNEGQGKPHMNFQGRDLALEPSVRMLGIYIDENLNYKHHLDHLCQKLAQGCFALRTISSKMDHGSILVAYHGVVYSHLRFGIVFWGGSCDVQRVFVLQKRIVRAMFSMRYRESCRGVFRQHGLLTVYAIYIYECIMYLADKGPVERHTADHAYNTRGRNVLCEYPIHRLTVTEHAPGYSSVRFFNALPERLRTHRTGRLFRRRIRDYLCDLEPYSLAEFVNG